MEFGLFSTSETETCRKCKRTFQSRNKLHIYLREECLRKNKKDEAYKSQDDIKKDPGRGSKIEELETY